MHSGNDYDKIIKAIDFFSQDLHEEQFSRYGYPFLHDLLNLKKSAFYMVKDFKNEESPFILTHKINSTVGLEIINNSKQLKNLAVFHGRYLDSNFDQYFPKSLLDQVAINLIIPIINKSVLYGFIISEDHLSYEGRRDYLSVINTVINMSFSYIVNHQILEERSTALRSEVYNLNMLTHLIAEIVSEKNLNNLYDLCIDSVRELTASAYTTVVFYDEILGKYATKASRDIIEHENLMLSYELNNKAIEITEKIYDVEVDFEKLDEIFVNAEHFRRINAKYILMMFDDRFQGFITIGKPVNGSKLDESTLYKINTIAQFILIAIKNANYIAKIERQNSLIESQLKTMKNLNEALNIINTCETSDELIDVVMTTLDIQFDVENYFFIKKEVAGTSMLYKKGDYEELIIDLKKLPSNFEYYYNVDLIPKLLNIDSDGHNCLIVAPIRIKESQEIRIYGYLIITKVKEKLEAYQLTAIKTISQLISPVIKSFIKIKSIEKDFLINKEALFLSKVNEALRVKKEYDLNFFIQYKKITENPFQEKREKIPNSYIFKNYCFKIIYDQKSVNEPWHLIEINNIEELIQYFAC